MIALFHILICSDDKCITFFINLFFQWIFFSFQPDLDPESMLEDKVAALGGSDPNCSRMSSFCPTVWATSSRLEHHTLSSLISEKVYHTASSLMEAVEICLKSTFVLGIQFPSASNSNWLLFRELCDLKSRWTMYRDQVTRAPNWNSVTISVQEKLLKLWSIWLTNENWSHIIWLIITLNWF